jgi:hypothetical protein
MEVKMKRYRLICFLMVMMLAVVLPVSLFSQEEDEEEEGGPIQAFPNPLVWKQLEQMEMLRNLKITGAQKGQVWQFDLRNIKLALEKAKINQKVTILYVNPEGIAYPLGTYSPLKRQSPAKLKSPANLRSPSAKEKLNKHLINPQPEPPRFHTIPSLKQVPRSAAVKIANLRRKGKAVLIFKDASGQIKAVVNLSMGPIPKREIPIKKRR